MGSKILLHRPGIDPSGSGRQKTKPARPCKARAGLTE